MLNWFIPKIPQHKLHHKFKFLKNFQYTSERELLSLWISNFKIKDGLEKTIKQFQETFHDVFWEIYLNEVFIRSGHTILEDMESPDFCLEKNKNKIFVEAVASNIAKTELKESERTLDHIYGENDHYHILDEAIVRIYNSLSIKKEKYLNNYSSKAGINKSPFILAIGDYAQVNYGQSYYYPLLALLYGAYYDPNDLKIELKILCEDDFGKEYKHIINHTKKNGAKLAVGIFNTEEYEHISAIIYSCTTTLGKLTSLSYDHIPFEKFIVLDKENSYSEYQTLRYSKQTPDETLYDGLFVYHNPIAINKLPEDFLTQEGVTHIRYKEDDMPAITISNKENILKRRQVGMKGTEQELIKNLDEFIKVPVIRR